MIWALCYETASTLKKVAIGLLMVFEYSVHSGNVLIGFLFYFYMLAILIAKKKSFSSIKKFSGLVLISLAVSIIFIISSNVIFHQGFTFNRWGKVIFLARILEDGPALKYLNSICEGGPS